MQTATVMTRINRETTLKLVGVTPAELLILREMHQKKVGADIVDKIELTDDQPRPGEADRLKRKYRKGVVEKLWPGVSKNLPKTFAEIGVAVTEPAPVVEAKPVVVEEPEVTVEEPVEVKKAPVKKQSKLV